MTAKLNEKFYNRYLLLSDLYEVVEGLTNRRIDMQELANERGLINGQFREAYSFLHDKGLINALGKPYQSTITRLGIDAIEDAQRHPEKETAHFPALKEMGVK